MRERVKLIFSDSDLYRSLLRRRALNRSWEHLSEMAVLRPGGLYM